LSAGVVANALFCSGANAGKRCTDCEDITTPASPSAIILPNSSRITAVPNKSTLSIVAGDACEGETPAA